MSDTDSTRVKRWTRLALCVLGLCSLVTKAGAETYDSAGAEVLFREGKRLMEQKDYVAACPKLAESYRLDPATGSLLALALCYERAGKLASAWVAYTDAIARAKREGQTDRERGAEARARELEPKLTKLIVTVEVPDTPGLEVVRDGVHLGAAALGAAIPVDAGEHVIEARAPGREPFRKVIEATGPGELTVAVPELVAARADVTEVRPEPITSTALAPDADEPDRSGSTRGGSTLGTAGIAALAVGAVGLAIGSYYGVKALALKKEADCPTTCDGEAYDKQQQAYDAGNVSTIAFVAGGVLAATGVTLYLMGAPDDTAASSAPRGYAVSVSGRF
ncbi:MAG TPA: hypothetical protein VFU02_14685 [Polyangiaceae bacterium]|nr:hypothetical protein [Polyangiaceae bacterium]